MISLKRGFLTEAVGVVVVSRSAGVALSPGEVPPAGTLTTGGLTPPVTSGDPGLGTQALLTVRVSEPAVLASE